jgi:dihydroorotase
MKKGFDSRYKVSPPLRAEIDRKALLKGIEDGTIDMITSDHNPIDIEHKKWNLMVLKMEQLVWKAFGALMTVLPLETVIDKLTGKTTLVLQ